MSLVDEMKIKNAQNGRFLPVNFDSNGKPYIPTFTTPNASAATKKISVAGHDDFLKRCSTMGVVKATKNINNKQAPHNIKTNNVRRV